MRPSSPTLTVERSHSWRFSLTRSGSGKASKVMQTRR
jgi:hypothetical protein